MWTGTVIPDFHTIIKCFRISSKYKVIDVWLMSQTYLQNKSKHAYFGLWIKCHGNIELCSTYLEQRTTG